MSTCLEPSCVGHGRLFLSPNCGEFWRVSSSSDLDALAVVDGRGRFSSHGPHYSRRTPGSKTFTGVGQEIVLVSHDSTAVWAVVRQRTPSRAGTGASRGRQGAIDEAPRYVWRNMLFRNLGSTQSSRLIVEATALTYRLWLKRYGVIPDEPLRTEINIARVRSANPGYCYRMAGWTRGETKRGILFYYAPAFHVIDSVSTSAG
jgi:hypothetical protein